MILQEYADIKINSRNFDYYRNIITNIKNNMIYTIHISNLFEGSHTKVLVSCDICKTPLIKEYRNYLTSYKKFNLYCCSPKCAQIKNKMTNLERYGVENVFESDVIKQKITETNFKKYGVFFPSQSKEIRYKMIETLLKNYGVENPMDSEIIKERIYNTNLSKYGNRIYNASEIAKDLRIKNNRQIPDSQRSEFELYQRKTRGITNNFKNILYENWNGFDYYDNEFIKNNNINYKFYNKNYPTIDHKISIYYGFINNISPEIIGNLENLCITKRGINSKKNNKNEDFFIN
jgi:hypothetical protein